MKFLMTANSRGSFGFLCPFCAWRSGPDHFFSLSPTRDIQSLRNILAVSFTTVSAKVHNPVCFRGRRQYFLSSFSSSSGAVCLPSPLLYMIQGIFLSCYINNPPHRWTWDIFPSKFPLLTGRRHLFLLRVLLSFTATGGFCLFFKEVPI